MPNAMPTSVRRRPCASIIRVTAAGDGRPPGLWFDAMEGLILMQESTSWVIPDRRTRAVNGAEQKWDTAASEG